MTSISHPLSLITSSLPSSNSTLPPLLHSYLSSLLSDPLSLSTDDPVRLFIHPLLQAEGVDEKTINRVCYGKENLTTDDDDGEDGEKDDDEDGDGGLQKWVKQRVEQEFGSGTIGGDGGTGRGGARVLEKAVSLSNSSSAPLLAPSSTVDITSTNRARASQVDVKKLEKAESKLRTKLEKRAAKREGGMRGVEFEGSKLVDAAKQQKAYEELFMKVNPLNASRGGKSKDIHLENIDVNFGSLRILNSASLTLADGRRYGLIGRNGIGKSTLLRFMALREVPIPPHITILYVEQEVLGDDTSAIDSVLSADVWRDRLLREEKEINTFLNESDKPDQLNGIPEEGEGDNEDTGAGKVLKDKERERKREEASTRLLEVQKILIDIEAESGPSRAATLLAGLGFSQDDQARPTKSFSGGWRMRLSLARALFCKPDLLLLDEPSNNLDLNALAWLEDYLKNEWKSTLLVVSHDRSFLDEVATDIIWQHDQRLDYYKGNFTQFYATKTERAKNQKREYEAQQQYRQHLQAFIDRWRYNANRAAQAQSKIKILEKLPELEPPEDEDVVKFKFAEGDKLAPPLLQLSEATFGYSKDKIILKNVNIDVSLDSRVGVIGPNGAGKSTLMKLLLGDLPPLVGQVNRNGRLRIGYFAQHHIDQLTLDVSPVAFLASRFPGQSEQEYRGHLGAFGISGMTGLQKIATLSGGQKSRVAFAALSLQRPHVMLLDEPTNHLDIEGLDALMGALESWNGGVIVISHDSRFIHKVCRELWVCADGKCEKFYGDVDAYKSLIISHQKNKPT